MSQALPREALLTRLRAAREWDLAVIGGGAVLYHGTPAGFEESLADKLWEAEIPQAEFHEYKKKFQVIANRYHMGRLRITVFSGENPGDKFVRKATSLEDAYFHVLSQGQVRAA